MKLTKLLALLLALAMVAAACGDSDGDDGDAAATTEATTEETTATTAAEGEEPASTTAAEPMESMAGTGGELVFLQWQAPSQANAYLSTGTKDLLPGSLVLEPLAEIAPDGSLVPALAAEIPSAENGGLAEDGMSITWTLQEGIVWSDGTPLTADDVVFTWEYCTNELTGCTADSFTVVTSVEALSDTEVRINFEAPQAYPFSSFVSYLSPILQRAQFADCVGDAAAGCSEQNLAPIGTGPYMVTEFRPEDVATFAYNPLYRKAAEGKPFFGTVVIQGGGDAESAARSVLEIGEADYAWNLQVAPEILQPMAAAGNGEVVVSFTANVEHLNMNQTGLDSDPPSEYAGGTNPNPFFFNDPELVKALSIAINRDELVAVGYGPNGSPTCNIWPVGAENSTNGDVCLTQDIDGANAILDGLGYLDTDGDGIREKNGLPLSWDLVTSTNAVRQSNQALIESYWTQIGVDVNMRNEDASLFFDGSGSSQVDIWKFYTDIEMFTNGASNPDAQGYLSGYLTEQIPESTNNYAGGNIPRLASEEYDTTWETLSQTPLGDPARTELIIRLNDIVSFESGALIPLIHRGNVSGIASDIEGFGDANGWDSEYWNIEDWTRAS